MKAGRPPEGNEDERHSVAVRVWYTPTQALEASRRTKARRETNTGFSRGDLFREAWTEYCQRHPFKDKVIR